MADPKSQGGQRRFRQAKTEGPSDNWSYDDRVRNFYGHEGADLDSRQELLRRGVKPNTPNLPSADYRMDAPDKVVKKRKR